MASAAGAADMAKPAVKRKRDRAVVVRKRNVRDLLGGCSGADSADAVVDDSTAEVDCLLLPTEFRPLINSFRGMRYPRAPLIPHRNGVERILSS